ncbi:16S rRNA (uracil(1498)-N(3))-methyltransferase [Methylococcaceae bacterium CS1]|uniref:16S rRNA (uracil(1498)-N(3))-methyltransferase n=1 Tax=Bathymodiolus platifrons methanotrophic gill symbiont TaxID=113268 RepID=UPI000B41F0EA|nr:16S rRNA (uracil(1498)-N(3))-methyltransferase [Bathymodiolus platifrons methanotrophic gill symbiont]MCK5870231.1 16S rRNA (uracil(1498)-N(3))-methyltransferase [Methyloprofundus sp.]TXK98043.1 16S rRNA (uracil(1498)-N(3))-methyltransferase [Methylococcaceae bacterium CS5]TXK99059.1 16S rRNA (uracil(1498)-N(3))-methyltransferase [Methylococcaceae bacterium CS4]TXL08545.1 16S rRNA (uracil(1498)-N(3))-methyltransferase [Methylococcaceae bacterium CS3]TXL09160.1 16S rRNA (uracil(1498)-N(3))-m
MRVSRLYLAMPLALHKTIELDEDGAHYLRAVLRLKKGQLITLFNGEGGEFQGQTVEVSRKRVLIELQSFVSRSVESALQVNLGLGISRGDRMDFSVQKSVELGIHQIAPLQTERCVVQLKAEKGQNKVRHWQKIAQHAAEQSGRTYRPKVEDVDSLEVWVNHQDGLKVFLDPFATQTLQELQPEANKVTLLAGPEGGFSEQEREIAKQAGFISVQLGPRILRTETAALAALTAVQVLWGDLGAKDAE